MIKAVHVISILLLATGCTQIQYVSLDELPASELNSIRTLSKGDSLLVFLSDGNNIAAQEIDLAGDTISWIPVGSEDRVSKKMTEIKKVEYYSKKKGAKDGFRTGFPISFIAGFLAVMAFRDDSPPEGLSTYVVTPQLSAEGEAVLGGFIGGLMGATFVGFPIGSIRGHRDIYYIKQ